MASMCLFPVLHLFFFSPFLFRDCPIKSLQGAEAAGPSGGGVLRWGDLRVREDQGAAPALRLPLQPLRSSRVIVPLQFLLPLLVILNMFGIEKK
jgi:hypothetical protein